MPSLYLPGVEDNPQPGIYQALIESAKKNATEYSMFREAHRLQGQMLASRGYVRD
jgi:hypothetical protein